MADSVNWNVILRLAIQGAKQSKDGVEQVQRAVDRLNKDGKISERQFDSNSRAIARLAQGSVDLGRKTDRSTSSLISQRYALYDVASTMLMVSGAITGVGVATATAFGSQEAAFTNVERIVQGNVTEVANLRSELQSLSTEIPKSFQDLSGIAAMGAALNIPATALDEFTKTVATFAATTGVTVEAAATGFGRLAQYLKIPKEQYEALGSAILKAGNISVATEDQVLKFTQALAPAAARVKFTAEEVVALGATIASFGNINVEGAGSALSRLTNLVERAIGESGESLENFARVAGYSANEFAIAWETDADTAFNRMLAGLSTVDNLTLALDELGIVNERDRRVISALSQNFGEFNRILGDTSSAWREGTYMSDAYGLVLDDLNSKFTIFLNAVTNAAAAIGSSMAPVLKDALTAATDFLVGLSKFAEANPWLLKQVGIVAGLVAGYAALRGGIALATASLFAMKTAGAFIGPGLINAVKELGIAMGILQRNTQTGAISFVNLSKGVGVFARSTGVIALVILLINLFTDLGGTVNWVGDVIRNFGVVLSDLADAWGNLGLWGADALKNGANQIRDAGKAVGEWSKTLPRATDATAQFDAAGGDATTMMEDFGDSMDGASDGASDLAKRIYTLVDYANDLSSVWTRAFDIRFGPESTIDAITSSVQSMRDAAEEAARNIRSLKAEIQGLESDINIQQRFLGIAIEYNDADRVQAIQANIAKLQEDLANKTADLNQEQQAQNRTLTGNSVAAVANRESLRGLVQQYQAHIQALAASGLNEQQLAAATQQLQQDFIAQATQLGYNQDELARYTVAFYDVTSAINGVPRSITVEANTDPALQALAEFAARAQSEMSTLGSNLGRTLGSGIGAGVDSGLDQAAKRITDLAEKMKGGSTGRGYAGAGGGGGGGGGFADGGYTGRGPRNAVAGAVHRGEYVVPARDVNQRTGLPYADALGRLTRGVQSSRGYAGGGYVRTAGSSSGQIDRFGPMAVQQLAQAMQPYLMLDSKVVAEGQAKQNAHQTNVGAW